MSTLTGSVSMSSCLSLSMSLSADQHHVRHDVNMRSCFTMRCAGLISTQQQRLFVDPGIGSHVSTSDDLPGETGRCQQRRMRGSRRNVMPY